MKIIFLDCNICDDFMRGELEWRGKSSRDCGGTRSLSARVVRGKEHSWKEEENKETPEEFVVIHRRPLGQFHRPLSQSGREGNHLLIEFSLRGEEGE